MLRQFGTFNRIIYWQKNKKLLGFQPNYVKIRKDNLTWMKKYPNAWTTTTPCIFTSRRTFNGQIWDEKIDHISVIFYLLKLDIIKHEQTYRKRKTYASTSYPDGIVRIIVLVKLTQMIFLKHFHFYVLFFGSVVYVFFILSLILMLWIKLHWLYPLFTRF